MLILVCLSRYWSCIKQMRSSWGDIARAMQCHEVAKVLTIRHQNSVRVGAPESEATHLAAGLLRRQTTHNSHGAAFRNLEIHEKSEDGRG